MDFVAIAWLSGFAFVGIALMRLAWSIDRSTEATRDHAESNRQLADATNQNAHATRISGGRKW